MGGALRGSPDVIEVKNISFNLWCNVLPLLRRLSSFLESSVKVVWLW
jgi:hypothetical protein